MGQYWQNFIIGNVGKNPTLAYIGKQWPMIYQANGLTVAYFSAVNGVKQGAVLSPRTILCLLGRFVNSVISAGVGCFIGCTFVGALAYADDIVLTAPTATAMRK
jgi:hypothetical protein